METFITWKQAFELDLGLVQKREKEDKNKKLTGRELFMQDKSLIESDLKFLEEGMFITPAVRNKFIFKHVIIHT